MKIKLHWKLFKNKDLVFIYPDVTIFLTNLQKVKIMDDYTIWTGPGDCILEIPNNHISRFKLSLYKEFIVLTLQEKSLHLDGMMAFMMFDTYGFPLELTEEIAAESGFTVDTNGFYVMQQLHKFKSG